MKKAGFLLATLMLVGGLVLVAGCIGSASQETPEGNWVLNSIGSEQPIGTISLDIIDKNASGNSGINNYRGTVTFDQGAGTISFGPMISTRMGGPEDKMSQEHAYLTALANATGYKFENGNLVLTDASGNAILTFGKTPVKGVAGTSWSSSDYEGVTLEFGNDDRFTGKAPVNGFFGGYTLTGDNGLTLGTVGATLMAGPEEKMQAESEFFGKLELVAGFKISGDVLSLTDKEGNVLLTFTKAEPASETPQTPGIIVEPPTIENIAGVWTLEGNEKVTLNLTTEGKFSGKAQVNNYFGSFEVVGSSIDFSAVGATLMAALDEAQMKAESEYFAALEEVTNFKLEDGKLIFLNADEEVVLTFVSE